MANCQTKKKELFENVKTIRSPNIDSDHYLLKITIEQKLPSVYRKQNKDYFRAWNRSDLQNLAKCRAYRNKLYTKLSNLPKQHEVEQEWEQIKTAILETAIEVIQTQKGKQKNGWWDEECKTAIQGKNEARKKWLRQGTRASSDLYHMKRNTANRVCANKKKE